MQKYFSSRRITLDVNLNILYLTILICSFSEIKAENDIRTTVNSASSTSKTISFGSAFKKLDVEDYPEPLESTRPDDVDNEIIDKIVENYLNKGTLEGIKQEKTNKAAEMLINSSSYWNTENLAPENSITDKEQAIQWLIGYLNALKKNLHQVAVDGWSYFTAASPITKENLEEAEQVTRDFLKFSVKQAKQFNIAKIFGDDPANAKYKHQMELISKQGMSALNDADLNKYNQILFNINQLYTTSLLCDVTASKSTPCINKFADLLSIYQSSSNVNQTLKWWIGWRLAAGANLTELYAQLVDISNKAAKLNNYKNIGEMWRSAYESKEFNLMDEVEKCYVKILPFYQQLHAYFRPRLAAIYGGVTVQSDVTRDSAIPSHLLKSLSGNWIGHYEQTKPFSDETIANTMITTPAFELSNSNETLTIPIEGTTTFDSPKLEISEQILLNFRAQNYTVKTMFTKAYRYMKYLGFDKLPSSFWSKSIFSRNWSKDMICNPATAYDMIDENAEDYRIKACSQLSEQEFINAHKLFAQLYYKYLSRNRTILLRDAPNPSLSTALSSAFGVLARNPDYLKGINLINAETEYSEPYIINHLYREALDQFVSLPYFLVADKWRYSVFEGQLNSTNWSDQWWKLRFNYQGVKAPSAQIINNLLRGEGAPTVDQLKALADFDAVSATVVTQQHAPAARNFVSYVLQFQILKQLCPDSKYLSQGCIPKKEKIAQVINAMGMGSSIPWIQVMEQLTGTQRLDAGPLLEYYEPLISWLKNSNQHENVVVGWKEGNGASFVENEIPKLRQNSADNEKPFLPGDEQIAYPGQSCSNGQECLLDSMCDGTICKCREGLFTLQIADTYNCVPRNPADAGFTDGKGGLVIALSPNENVTTTSSENDKSFEKDMHNHNKHDELKYQHKPTNSAFTMFLSWKSLLPIIFVLYNFIINAQNFATFSWNMLY